MPPEMISRIRRAVTAGRGVADCRAGLALLSVLATGASADLDIQALIIETGLSDLAATGVSPDPSANSSRPSSPIARPWAAARSRRRFLTAWGRLRTVREPMRRA